MIDRVTQHVYIPAIMFRNEAIILSIGLAIFLSCNPPVQSEAETDPIEAISFNYDQDSSAIFVSAKIKDPFNGLNVYSVRLIWHGTNGLDYGAPDSVYLNDAGDFGDILKNDDVYSRRVFVSGLTNTLVYEDTGTVYLKVLTMYVDSSVQSLADSFSLGNIKPRFLWIDAPDTLQRPGFGLALIETIRVKVADANGLDDIQWVGFTSKRVSDGSMLNNGNYIFMDDNADTTFGDLVARDSIYSVTVLFPYNASTGQLEWRFRSQDWSNDYRDTTHILLVLE